MEVLVAVPVLLTVTIAVLEFGIILLVEQAVVAAAAAGAREAAKEGASTTTIAAEVYNQLAVHHISLNLTGTNTADDAHLVIDQQSGVVGQRGNTSLGCSPTGNPLGPNQVRVTVCVRMTNTSNRPVPDWLSTLGFCLRDRTCHASALAYLE